MRKLMLMLAVLAMIVGAFSVTAQDDDVFRVAAVAPSATDDLAFSQSMYDALLAIQEEMGEENFQFDFQDGTFVVDDAAVAMRDWASSGEYDLVIGHGSQFGSVVEELAAEFPEVSFAWGTDENTFDLPNVFAYTAAAEEGGYINGVLAAEASGSGVIGVVGPIEVGDAKLYVDGFVEGATDTADVEVNVVYIQSFGDVTLATEAANTHISNGADVLTGTAQMVVGPIAVAIDEDVAWYGTQTSQAELSEGVGRVFQVYKWDVILEDIIASVEEGTLGGESYVITLENEGLEMEVSEFAFGGDEEAIEELQAEVDALVEQIVSGEIDPLAEDMEMDEEESEEAIEPEETEEAA